MRLVDDDDTYRGHSVRPTEVLRLLAYVLIVGIALGMGIVLVRVAFP